MEDKVHHRIYKCLIAEALCNIPLRAGFLRKSNINNRMKLNLTIKWNGNKGIMQVTQNTLAFQCKLRSLDF